MRLVVSGSRHGFRQSIVDNVMDGYLALATEPLVVIEGCAPGVDSQIHDWAISNGAWERFGRYWDWSRDEVHGLTVAHFPAQWKLHKACRCKPDKDRCNFAGHRRNLEMLALEPDEVVTFHADINHASKGTLHIAMEAHKRGTRLRQLGSWIPLVELE